MDANSKILLLGAGGRLGETLLRVLRLETPCEIVAVSRHIDPSLTVFRDIRFYEAELLERAVVKNLCRTELPNFVINAIAFTDVDACEIQKEIAWKVNVRLVEYLIQMSRLYDFSLVHYSSDYVFDGQAGPYMEEDRPSPINYYGRTKLASENVCKTHPERTLIIRTNVLYGWTRKPTFLHWVLEKLKKGKPFGVVNDQFSNPTLLDDVAYATLQLIQKKATGLYHVGGTDWMSRYEFARLIAKVFEYDPEMIYPLSTEQLRQIAARPLRAGLRITKIEREFGVRLTNPLQGLEIVRKQMQSARNRR